MSEANDVLQQLVTVIETPTIWASMGTTVNVGNYENIKIDVGISRIPVNATEEYIAMKMVEAELTIQRIVSGLTNQLANKIDEVKEAYHVQAR